MKNTIRIVGNIGSEPETRHLNGDNQLTTFSLASTRKWKDKNGEWQEKTTWFKVEAWNRLSIAAEHNLSKGDSVIVLGHMEENSWDDPKTGEKKSIMRVQSDYIGKTIKSPKSEQNENLPF